MSEAVKLSTNNAFWWKPRSNKASVDLVENHAKPLLALDGRFDLELWKSRIDGVKLNFPFAYGGEYGAVIVNFKY